MSNVIRLMERLGQDANAVGAARESLDLAAEVSDLPLAILEALKDGNQEKLVALLGARTNICCMILPSKQDDDDSETQDDDKDTPDDSTEKGLQQNLYQAALAC
jgi:hypothetical protein